jgi:glycosyltransferase involved in cell wall biosynthesis
MRVAHVVPVFPPYRSGTGNVAFHQARCLAATGVDVTVFTTRTAMTPIAPAGVAVVTLRPLVAHGNAACLPQVLWHTSGYDIIHVHYPFFGTAEILALKRLFAPPPIVLQYQFDVVGQAFSAQLFRWHRRLLLPVVLRGADAIIVTSMDYAASSFLRPNLPALRERLAVIPAGVDLGHFCPGSAGELTQNLGLHGRAVLFFLACLDHAHYFKGLPVFLEALREIPDVVAIIGGDGDLRASYEMDASRLGLEERVCFVGNIPDTALPQFYRAADAVVLPSVDATEAFGLVLLEAMACATPVVASDLPGVRTLVTEGRNGYLARPGDAHDLARAIARCLENAADLGRNARQMMESSYGWEATSRQLIELYTRLAATA